MLASMLVSLCPWLVSRLDFSIRQGKQLLSPCWLRGRYFLKKSWKTQLVPRNRKEASVLMYLRGGAYEEGVYICEPQDMDGEQGLLLPGTHAIDLTMTSTMPSMLRESLSACMRALNTNRDGACGIHALLGEPVRTTRGQLEFLAVDAREIAVTHLGPSLENLFQRVNNRDVVEAVRDFFWDGFVMTHLRERQEEGSESRLFWESLSHLMPDLAHVFQTIPQTTYIIKA